MEDILSPTHAFLDFDFSEFIDKNFDMTSDMFNSPNTKSPLLQLDDFLSSSSDSGSESKNYLTQSPLWSNMENLSFDKAPPTLSCIDDFIKDPHSDLVQLVQQCNIERSLFHSLITHSLAEHVSITPQQVLQEQQQQQRLYQQQQLQKLQQHNFVTQLPQQPLDLQTYQNLQPPIEPQRKRKNNSIGSSDSNIAQQSQKRVSKSSSYSSNNSSYTHSDSVNAHLLRELIRQAGRNNTNRNSSMDSNCSSTASNSSSNLIFPPDYSNRNYLPNGNYQTYRHHPYYTPSSPSSRHNLPYHIQTKKLTTKLPKTVINRPSSANKSNHHPMGRPSMYSSDISQAQLLEIQAISRAQQDFIRAREQQEAEKEIMMKHQHKKQGI